MQVLIEVLTTALLGITLSIFDGNMIANSISREFIRIELAQPTYEETEIRDPWIRELSDLGYGGGRLSPEEMLEAFDTSLDANSIAFFYVIGLGTVVVSTLIPIVYVVKLKPKKVLL